MRVLIAGGGVAGIEAALALRVLAGKRVATEVLTPEDTFEYRPLATSRAWGDEAEIRFDLAELLSEIPAQLRIGRLESVDRHGHRAHTSVGELEYESLIVACGAEAAHGLPGALAFRGGRDVAAFRELLNELASGAIQRIAFVLPLGRVWPLPLYELALAAASVASIHGDRAHVTLVTAEEFPLAWFGPEASQAIAALLDERGVEVLDGAVSYTDSKGRLCLEGRGPIPVERVVTVPPLRGVGIRGIPTDREGFIKTDDSGRIAGAPDVYACGDATAFPIKFGGIATQQADAVAAEIAQKAGAPITPPPWRPILRGKLLTGREPLHIWSGLKDGRRVTSIDVQPLWWPPAKIAGRYLSPFLAERIGSASTQPPKDMPGAVSVEAPIDRAA